MNKRLEIAEIEKLASRKGARKIAVENFLASLPTDSEDAERNAYLNLDLDSRLYKWNAATVKAIRKGIERTFRK
jgi:nitrous oxide reductase